MSWRLPTKWILPENDDFYLSFFEKDELYTMTNLEFVHVIPELKNKRVALDIGAHIGTTAIRYAKHFERVYAFEPFYYDILCANIGYQKNNKFFPYAISDSEKTVEMKRSKRNSGATQIVTEKNKESLKKQRFNQTVTKATTIAIDSLGLSDVDFIKIDTEGYVYPVLVGMAQTLKNNSPVLQIEDPDKRSYDLLSHLGYKQFDSFSVERFFRKVQK